MIASDECYSEIFFDETRPPLGALAAAHALGRDGYPRLAVFGSLSKRSNAPGLRSGYVAGDAALMKAFLLYRTYHGAAMSPAVAAASIAAWNDEAHVIANRAEYAAKFAALQPALAPWLPCAMPDAAFYLWARTPIDDDAVRAAAAGRGERGGRSRQFPCPGRPVEPIQGRTGSGWRWWRPAAECAEAIDRVVAFARTALTLPGARSERFIPVRGVLSEGRFPAAAAAPKFRP